MIERRRRALVTGAAREGGIGRAIADRLERDGLDIVTLDALPGCTYQCDISSDPLPEFDDIDVCVANAGHTTSFGSAHRMPLEKWQRDLDVNLTGTFRVIQRCLPGMRERGFGRIIAIMSTSSMTGMPAQVGYSASKAGLVGVVRTVAAENVTLGITANAVLPGMTASSGILSMPQEIQQAWLDSLPNGFVDPGDIADAVSFFASPSAKSVTGQLLTVDAGDGLNMRSVTSSVVKDRT